MNKEQLNSDKKVLASLEAEYKRAQRVIYSIRALVTDLNFEELIPDSQERCLMVDELQAYDYIRTNLMNRIRFYRNRIKRDENVKDWSQYKKTDSAYISVDVSNEGDHGACTQVCGDDMFQTQHDPNFDDVDPEQKAMAMHHCGQDAHDPSFDDAHHCGQDTRHRDEAANKLCDLLAKGRMIVFAPGKKCDKCGGNMFEGFGGVEGDKILCFNCASQITKEELQQALDEYRSACTHHCGQDASCQVDDGNAVVNDIPDSLKSLEGMQVIKVCGPKCKDCPCGDGLREYPSGRDASSCVKVELVGGYYLCLAPLPNSIVTE